MRKAAGFTLIELVIVIVILGILGAVAAPKFLNLQGDAYSANIKSLAGSLQSAATLANTKAILENKDQTEATEGTEASTVTLDDYGNVKFTFGYPIADTVTEEGTPQGDGILGTLQSVPSVNDYKITSTGGVLTLQPQARSSIKTKCFVKYTQATAINEPATIAYDADCK